MVWLAVFRILNVHADADALNCTEGWVCEHHKRACTESQHWEKNPLICSCQLVAEKKGNPDGEWVAGSMLKHIDLWNTNLATSRKLEQQTKRRGVRPLAHH